MLPIRFCRRNTEPGRDFPIVSLGAASELSLPCSRVNRQGRGGRQGRRLVGLSLFQSRQDHFLCQKPQRLQRSDGGLLTKFVDEVAHSEILDVLRIVPSVPPNLRVQNPAACIVL